MLRCDLPADSSGQTQSVIGLVHRHLWWFLVHLLLPFLQNILQQFNLRDRGAGGEEGESECVGWGGGGKEGERGVSEERRRQRVYKGESRCYICILWKTLILYSVLHT